MAGRSVDLSRPLSSLSLVGGARRIRTLDVIVTPGLAVLKFGVTYTVSAAASPEAQLELMVGSPIVCLFLSGIDIGRTEGVPAAPPRITGAKTFHPCREGLCHRSNQFNLSH